MNKLIKFVKVFFQKQLDRFPTRLPDGVTAYEKWCQGIISTYGFPDNDSVRFMLAAMIMNLGGTDAYKPKRYFGLSGLAAASKEVARDRMVQIKEAHEAKAKSEAPQLKAVAATTDSSSSGQGI